MYWTQVWRMRDASYPSDHTGPHRWFKSQESSKKPTKDMFRSPICWVFSSHPLDVGRCWFPEGLLQLVLQFLVELLSLWGCGTGWQRLVRRDIQCAFLVMSTKQHVWHPIRHTTRINPKHHRTLSPFHVISWYDLQVGKVRKRGGGRLLKWR